MFAMTLTSDYTLTLPEELHKDKRFTPGTTYEVLVIEGVISLIPVRPMAEMRGFITMKDTEIERDDEDRL